MPQRKDKSDKPGHQDAVLGMISLLESPEPEMVESVKNMIHENLSSSRDSRLLNNLVDFYVATQSKNSFEILLQVKDPHDKHLFEKINEMMKNETTRYNALQLLSSIVYKQPTWLHKISGNRLMHTLIEMLKNDVNSPNLLCGLFILICLIPVIPHLYEPLLTDTFDIFSRLAAWGFKKPSSLSGILNLHLQTGIYSLFHRLYGLFPCNFLAYLRSYYGGRDADKFKVFSYVIKPMLERVRLHPLLVTASKEAELSPNRWKRMAYHDIIVECASISLDTIEGTYEHFAKTNISSSTTSEKISSYESRNSVTFICQDNASAIISSGLISNDNTTVDQDHVWSPSQACTTALFNYSSNPSSPTTAKSEWDFKNIMQSSTEESIPLDFAIEAKPEPLKNDLEISDKLNSEANNDVQVKPDKDKSKIPLKKRISSQKSVDSDTVNINSKMPASTEIKEDDVDKEVSELTSTKVVEQNLSPTDIRHDTPFCHTTQNLTDEPTNFAQTSPLSEKCDGLLKNDDDVDETYCSMQESDLQSYIPSFSRYRYFSQCGPPPDLPLGAKQPKASRSRSCPPEICLESEIATNKLKSFNVKTTVKTKIETACSNNVIANTTTSAFVSLNSENSFLNKQTLPVYHKLLPAVVNPLQGFDHPIIIRLSDESAQSCHTKSMSPPELLDCYIQQGNAAYIYNLPSSSGKDTDWIRFGDMPPSDKIDVLRNQILLLHNMLLFERHRKDIHSERNRRILGRAKRAKMAEEYVDALKKEITILIEENENLKTELSNRSKMYQHLQIQMKQSKEEFDSRLYKNSLKNAELLYSNKQLQTLLVSQKEEINEINELYKKSQCEVAVIKSQLKYASMEMQNYQKLKKEAIFLTKQLILLQELNGQYKNKIEQMKEPRPDVKADEMNKTLLSELKDLNKKLETKTIHLDSARGKISELENMLSKMRRKQREETGSHEKMKSYHQAEIMVRDERLMDMRKISSEKDAHILKLYAELEELREKIEFLSKKECHALSDKCSNSRQNPQLEVDKIPHQQKKLL